MPTKIRLQRCGRKKKPFFHIVIADGRAPRDGKYIEKIGTYNPLPHPAEINIDFDKVLSWLQKGAQPTATVRSILSYKGVLYKNHLQKGVKKGALTQEEANQKFEAWLKEKEEKIANETKNMDEKKKEAKEKLLEAERKINEDRAADLADRRKKETKANSGETSEENTEETAGEKTEDTAETTEKATEEKTDNEKSEENKSEESKAEEAPADKNSDEKNE